jgi:MFS family permease
LTKADLRSKRYNIGILASIYVHPGFKAALHSPTAAKTGLITAIYYLGTWLSYIFLSYRASDILGRRYASMIGMTTVCVGSALQAGATGGARSAYAMMIVGRIICGLGLAIVSTAVPLYQSEVAPSRRRGRYVVMNHIGLVAGLATAFWFVVSLKDDTILINHRVGYGVSFWKTPHGLRVGWRMSIALQYIPAIIFIIGLPFCHDT